MKRKYQNKIEIFDKNGNPIEIIDERNGMAKEWDQQYVTREWINQKSVTVNTWWLWLKQLIMYRCEVVIGEGYCLKNIMILWAMERQQMNILYCYIYIV